MPTKKEEEDAAVERERSGAVATEEVVAPEDVEYMQDINYIESDTTPPEVKMVKPNPDDALPPKAAKKD